MIRRCAAALLAFALGTTASAGELLDGKVAIATHRGDRTYVFIAAVPDLPADVRGRLLGPALPEAFPAEPDTGARTLLATFQPVGTPFAGWAGRRLQGFLGARAVCVKSVRRLVLLGAVPSAAQPSDEAMAQALAAGVVAGEMDDLEGACRTADWFHDPDLGALPVADATTLDTATPEGRDEILGGVGRLRLQPQWVALQQRFEAAHRPAKVPVGVPPPDAGSAPMSWDGRGAQAVRFPLGASAFVASASASPDCSEHLALLFHAMNRPILIWPFLSLETRTGSLPSWIADVGGLWPVVFLDGKLLGPTGDHYQVLQRFPGTPTPACPHAP